ncbi:hypothetical protein AABM17_1704 [Neisseria musculi]|uniref:Uncharacterized protein n=1 Tax=Neisseria musculi TaxID=1815583 RepID=A0A7H1M9Y0_9NEIS|nr:hypothetical protein H7A79_1703 [Neisseria musculi]
MFSDGLSVAKGWVAECRKLCKKFIGRYSHTGGNPNVRHLRICFNRYFKLSSPLLHAPEQRYGGNNGISAFQTA